MDRGLAVIVTALVGGLIALQPPVNAGLARDTGNIGAAFISFLIGTIALAAILLASGKAGGLGSAMDVRWYYLIGGLLGVAYVTTALITVGTIGAGGVAAATVTGQLTAGIVIDRLGILGLQTTPISTGRMAGGVLLLAGTYLIVR